MGRGRPKAELTLTAEQRQQQLRQEQARNAGHPLPQNRPAPINRPETRPATSEPRPAEPARPEVRPETRPAPAHTETRPATP